jgi:5-methyltetrahydrofolate--homocysteine methyltransferase
MVGVLLGDDSEAPVGWARDVLAGDIEPLEFFNDVFTPAMAAIGDKFAELSIFLPELISSAERAQAINTEVLAPMLAETGDESEMSRGRVVLCTVKGDLHDIGKNMVSLMLQVNGFEVIDMGINVTPREVLAKAQEVEADIVGLSALMTTSQPYMKECVELRDGFGLKDAFAIVVGGAPITSEYAETIGADSFGKSATEAVDACQVLMAQRGPKAKRVES